MDDKIKSLNDKLNLAYLGGGQARIDKQHEKKKLTARERVMYLLDDQSFEEIGAFTMVFVSVFAVSIVLEVCLCSAMRANIFFN